MQNDSPYELYRFDAADVTDVFYSGNAGDDVFVNRTNLESLAYGNDGDDWLLGGSDAEILEQESWEQFSQAVEEYDRVADEVATIVDNDVDVDDFDLKADDSETKLYFNDSGNVLSTFDTSTGEFEVIGNLGVTLTDIAMSANGELYGISFGSLYRVDAGTAETKFVGNLGRNDMNGLGFDDDGRLLATGYLGSFIYEVNTETGKMASLGDFSARSSGDLTTHDGQTFVSTTSGSLVAVEFDSQGDVVSTNVVSKSISSVTYGLASLDGEFYSVVGSDLYSVNPTDGAFSSVNDLEGLVTGTVWGMTASVIS